MISEFKNKINPKCFFAGLFVLAAVPQMCIGADLVSDSFYFTLIPIGMAVYIFLRKDKELSVIIQAIKSKKHINIFSILLTLLFLIMLSITQLVSSGAFSYQVLSEFYGINFLAIGIIIWNFVFYLPVMISSVFLCINYMFSYAMTDNSESKTDCEKGGDSVKSSMIIISILTFICLFSTYPGIYMQDDVISVWQEVTENHLYDWHPIGYELFCKLCFYIFQSPFTVNVVQSVGWLILNYQILRFFNEICPGGKAVRFYTLAAVFVFTPFLYLQVMMKDIVYSICLTAFTLQILIILNRKAAKKDFVLLIVSGLGAALFRHAQMLPVMMTLIICIIFSIIKNRKLLKGMIAAACSILALYIGIVPVLSFQILNATPNPSYTTYTTPFAMVGAAVANGVQFDEEDTQILEQIMPLEDYAQYYSKYYLDDISRSWGRIGDKVRKFAEAVEEKGVGKELIRMNAELLLTHPVIYVTALFDASSIIWEIGRPLDLEGEWGVPSLTENYDLITYNAGYNFINPWSKLTAQLPIYRDICSRGGASLFAIILGMVLLILKKRYRDIIAFAPILIVSMLLLITTPAQHTRYILQAIECALLLFPYSLFVRKQFCDVEEKPSKVKKSEAER